MAKVLDVVFDPDEEILVSSHPWQPTVLSATLTTPPSSPTDGDRYVVPVGATGAWASLVGRIAYAVGGAWSSYAASEGWQVYDIANNKSLIFKNAAWSEVVSMVYPGTGIAVSNGLAWGSSITDNSANWNAAYGWGNHASAGYVTGTPWTGLGYLTGIVCDSPLSGAGTSGSHLTVDLSSKLGVNAQAADSAKLENHAASYFQIAGSYLTAESDPVFAAWLIATPPLFSLSGAVLTSQATPQTIGSTTERLSKLWATDITLTNALSGSVTGNAGTVSNATFTTALTNSGGAGTLSWPVAGATLTIPATGQALVANVAASVVGYIPFYSTITGSVSSDSNLFWDNINKRLGIGTTGPVSPLQVIGPATFGAYPTAIDATRDIANFYINNTSNAGIVRFYNGGAGQGMQARFIAGLDGTSQTMFTDSSHWIGSMAVTGVTATPNSNSMQFRLRGASDADNEGGLTAAAKMTILGSGNVGIGTTSPTEKLHIYDSGGTPVALKLSSATGGGTTYLYGGGGNAQFQFTGSTKAAAVGMNVPGGALGDDLQFSTYLSSVWGSRMTILNNGNVGIGTTAPKNKLQIDGVSSTMGITFDVTNGSVMGHNIYYNGGWKRLYTGTEVSLVNYADGGGTKSDISFYQATTGAADSTITFTNPTLYLQNSTGNVGIGTTGPASKLEVVANDSLAVLNLKNLATTGYSAIQLNDSAGSAMSVFGYGNSTVATTGKRGLFYLDSYTGNGISFFMNAVEKVRIDNNGNVGIGISTGIDSLLQLGKADSSGITMFKVNPTVMTSGNLTDWQINSVSKAAINYLGYLTCPAIVPPVGGLKLGTATSDLIGFYGVAAVDQPATVADPSGGATQDAEARTAIASIIDRLQELGLIA
jgi:hypothetical protein